MPSPRASNGAADTPPLITGMVVNGVQVSITVSTTPGRTYRVEYKDDLGLPIWTSLNGDQAAAGPSLIFQDNLGSDQHRFYRAALVP